MSAFRNAPCGPSGPRREPPPASRFSVHRKPEDDGPVRPDRVDYPRPAAPDSMSVRQAAIVLGLTEASVYRLREWGTLEAAAGLNRVTRASVDAFDRIGRESELELDRRAAERDAEAS